MLRVHPLLPMPPSRAQARGFDVSELLRCRRGVRGMTVERCHMCGSSDIYCWTTTTLIKQPWVMVNVAYCQDCYRQLSHYQVMFFDNLLRLGKVKERCTRTRRSSPSSSIIRKVSPSPRSWMSSDRTGEPTPAESAGRRPMNLSAARRRTDRSVRVTRAE